MFEEQERIMRAMLVLVDECKVMGADFISTTYFDGEKHYKITFTLKPSK